MFEIAPNFRAIDPSDPAFTSPQFVPRQIGFSAVVDDLVVNVVRRHIVACPNIYLGMVAKHLPETQVVVEVKETLDFEIRVLIQLPLHGNNDFEIVIDRFREGACLFAISTRRQ